MAKKSPQPTPAKRSASAGGTSGRGGSTSGGKSGGGGNSGGGPRILNRKAHHDYHILEKIEVGIELAGSEVKSVRNGQVSLAEGFAHIEPATEELFLHNVHIGEYKQAGPLGHVPVHPRKLLAHKREIVRLLTQTDSKGLTLIPLAMYFVRGWAKVELGLAAGKKQHDKRQDLKSREADRAIRRAMTRKTL
ncbi:MAG: SsrA-binding protein SmpB [Phycisphaeraceae bacterium]|nr:SsrA-binding protein SmpB [Phycisphaeraceae bacterium]